MKKYISIGVSLIALIIILFIAGRYCGRVKTYTQAEFEQLKKQHSQEDAAYKDTIDFIKGERDLWANRATATQDRVFILEKSFDSLYKKHQTTKTGLKPPYTDADLINGDTNYTLAPQEYITECEQCFEFGSKLKKENVQLKFERDSYDNLMRAQAGIDSARISKLTDRSILLAKKIDTLLTADNGPRRKVKLSVMGMGGNPVLPWGGGAGLLYEDKKENLFGGHALITQNGFVYFFNYAKTISFKRKK